MIAFTELVYGN